MNPCENNKHQYVEDEPDILYCINCGKIKYIPVEVE